MNARKDNSATSIGARKLYQRIADAVAAAIRENLYPPGARLPSERDLAEEFGVSRPTIREAVKTLVAAKRLTVKPAGSRCATAIETAAPDKIAAITEPRLSILEKALEEQMGRWLRRRRRLVE